MTTALLFLEPLSICVPDHVMALWDTSYLASQGSNVPLAAYKFDNRQDQSASEGQIRYPIGQLLTSWYALKIDREPHDTTDLLPVGLLP